MSASLHLSPFRFLCTVLISLALLLFLFWVPIIGPFSATFLATFLTVNTRKQGFWASLLSTSIISFGISGLLLYVAFAIDKALWVVGAVIQSILGFSVLQYGFLLGLTIIGHTTVFGCIGGFLAGLLKERTYAKTK